MVRHTVLTAIGTDRPGLVDEVTGFIAACGCNLEDSRMVNLRGQFAMVVLVAGSSEAMARLCDGIAAVEAASGIRAQLADAGEDRPEAAAALPFKLETWAMDHVGLLQAVSHLLHSMQANIETAQTSLHEAPMTGTPIFAMELEIAVPASLAIAELRAALAALCDELNMDWRLTAL